MSEYMEKRYGIALWHYIKNKFDKCIYQLKMISIFFLKYMKQSTGLESTFFYFVLNVVLILEWCSD